MSRFGVDNQQGVSTKILLMHQASLRKFQIEFKFGIKDKKWR